MFHVDWGIWLALVLDHNVVEDLSGRRHLWANRG